MTRRRTPLLLAAALLLATGTAGLLWYLFAVLPARVLRDWD
ncbi:hypothetical protein [Kitasatospora sp. NPDC097643]